MIKRDSNRGISTDKSIFDVRVLFKLISIFLVCSILQ